MSAVEDLTRDDEPRAAAAAAATGTTAAPLASGAGGASGGSTGVSPFSLTRDRKKHYVDHPSERIPLVSLGAELRLLGSACSPPDAGAKNCKACVHCLHGLGVHKRGVWDAKGAAAAALLGADPNLRARPADSHVGLRNLGATCYFNTLLQCLYMTAAFRRAVYLFEPPSAPMPHMQIKASASAEDAQMAAALAASAADAAGNGTDASAAASSGGSGGDDHGLPAFLASKPQFLQHLQDLFTHLEHSRTSPYDPAHMVDALGLSHGDQQDVHELMNLLVFQVLDRGLAASRNPVCQSTIPRLFTGHTVHVMQGQGCRHTSERVSEFHDLSQIQIKGKKKLQDCLDDYFREERMEHEKPEYRWKCGTCNERENATRYTYLRDLPPLLILQLGRFEFDINTMGKKKLADAIQLPAFLDLSKYMQPAAATNTATAAAASPSPAAAAAAAAAPASADSAAAAPVCMDESSPAADSAATVAAASPNSNTRKRGRPPKRDAPAAAAVTAASSPALHVAASFKGNQDDATPAAQAAMSVQQTPAAVPISSLSGLSAPKPAAKGRGRKKAAPAAAAASIPAAAAGHDSDPVDLTGDDGAAAAAPEGSSGLALISAPGPEETARLQTSAQCQSDADLARWLAAEDDNPKQKSRVRAKTAQPVEAEEPPAKKQRVRKNSATPKAPAAKRLTKKQQQDAEAEAAAAAAAAGLGAEAAAGSDASLGGVDPSVEAVPLSDGADIVVDSSLNRDGPNMYQLVAVLLHKGTSANRGHYTAEIFDLERNEWFSFDDGKVSSKNRRKKTEATKADSAVDATTVESASHAAPVAETAAGTTAAAATTAVDADTDVPMVQTAEAGETAAVPIAVDAEPADVSPAAAAADTASPISPSTTAAAIAVGDSASAAIDVDAEGEAADTPKAAAPTKRTRKSKLPKTAAAEAAAAKPPQPAAATAIRCSARASAENAKLKMQVQQMDESSPSPPAVAASKPKSRKFSELDDEEKGDEDDYDPASSGKPAAKKRGGGGRKPKATVAEKAKAKADKAKAEVSVGAASTAYILIYRRRDTIRADWNPFEDVEREMAALAAADAAASTAAQAAADSTPIPESSAPMDTSDSVTATAPDATAAATPVEAPAAPAAAVTPTVPSIFLSASAPRVFLDPVEAANREFEAELLKFREREARLNAAIEARKQRIETLLEVVQPDDFETVAAAVDASQPPPPPPTTVKAETPSAVKEEDSPKTAQRRSARKSVAKGAAAAANAATDVAPAAIPAGPPAQPISSVRMGHYVSTQWLSAYLTGWLIEKEEVQAADATAKEGPAAGVEEGAAAAATGSDVKEEHMETDEAAAKESAEEPAEAEVDAGAASPAAPGEISAAAAASSADGSAPASAAAPVAAALAAPVARTLTPLQLFLQSHPNNDDLPFPGDLLESVNALRCSHGKLSPAKLSSAKRISCAAYRMLLEDNTHWKTKEQTRIKCEQDERVKMEDDVKIIETHDDTTAAAAAAAAVPSSPIAATSVAPSSCLASSLCPCLSCSQPGLTDADLCPECARQSLLGETMLQELHEKNMRVFDAYVRWNEEEQAKGTVAEDVKDAHGVSTQWWRNWKKQLDAAAKALQLTPISTKKGRGRTPAAPSVHAAPAAPKPLPTISEDDDITADIRCPHDNLKPDSKHFPVGGDIWRQLLQLHPRSKPVPLLREGQSDRECPTCVEQRDRESSDLKQHKEKLRAEKGRLKFIKSKAQIIDFPAPTKAPHDGAYHILPTDWAVEMFHYFSTQGEAEKPKPASTAALLCKHNGLRFHPLPEDDKSSLPQVAALVASAAASNAAPAAASADGAAAAAASSPSVVASALCSAQRLSRLHTTPIGVLTIVDKADYEHLQSQHWIDPSSTDIVMTVSKNPQKHAHNDISTWTHIAVEFSPQPCDECIAERLNSEHSDSLVFTDQLFDVHRIKTEEKVSTEDDAAIAASLAIMEGRRISTRKRVPARGPARKPVEVVASSSDTMLNFKLKIFEACGMEVGHQEVIWVKEDHTTVMLDDENKTLSDYGIPANAELRLRLNPFAQQKLYEEATGKGGIEHGFRGTALSSAPPPPPAASAAQAASAAAGSVAGAPSSPVAAAASTSSSLPTTPVAAAAAAPVAVAPAAVVIDESQTVPASEVEVALAVPPASPTVSELEEGDEPDNASHPPSFPAAAAAAAAVTATPMDPSPAESAQPGAVADSAAPMEMDEEPGLNVAASAAADDAVPALVAAAADVVDDPDPVPASTAAPVFDAAMSDALDSAIASDEPPVVCGSPVARSSRVPPPQLPAITAQACAEAVAQNQHEAKSRAMTSVITIDDDDEGADQADEHKESAKETHAPDVEQPQAAAAAAGAAAAAQDDVEPTTQPEPPKAMHTR